MQLPTKHFVEKHTPIYPGSNFTWGEATKKLSRPIQDLIQAHKLVTSDREIETNIIKVAKYLDKVRNILDDRPLHITSWYRPLHINKRVGGSSNSQHLYGLAVDFKSNYFSPADIYQRLEGWHGNNGGLAKYYKFVHLDLRGYRARW